MTVKYSRMHGGKNYNALMEKILFAGCRIRLDMADINSIPWWEVSFERVRPSCRKAEKQRRIVQFASRLVEKCYLTSLRCCRETIPNFVENECMANLYCVLCCCTIVFVEVAYLRKMNVERCMPEHSCSCRRRRSRNRCIKSLA